MRPRVVYIAGTGRSGSSLVAALLGRLDGCVVVGELRYIWRRGLMENHLCQCGRPFRDCRFWVEVVERAFDGLAGARAEEMVRMASRVDRIRYIPWLTAPALRPARFQSDLQTMGDVLNRLYSAILSVSGGSVVVDSSKDPSYAYLLCAQPSLDVALAHLVRDSRAVAYSWTRQKVRPEIHWKVEHMRRRPAFLTARRWMQYNLMLEALSRRVPTSVRIRYEDVVVNPETAMTTMAGLVGKATPEGQGSARRTAAGETVHHSMSGNPMRFEPLVVRPDRAWIDSMATADRRLVTALTAPLLVRYGYLGSRSPRPILAPAVENGVAAGRT